MATLQEQIAVMQHFANGGKVEYMQPKGEWAPINSPCWNWLQNSYRVS